MSIKITNMDAIHAYEEINKKIDKEIFQLDDYSEIQYGIQCNIVYKAKTYLVRIYNSKKGTKLDLSQKINLFKMK